MLEPLGYEFQGVNGNKHLIWLHRETGAIYRMSQSGWKDGGAAKGGVASAQRSVRHAQSVGHRFVAWLLDEYGVGVTEERKGVQLSVSAMGRRFLTEHPEIRGTSEGLWRVALQNSSQATLVERGKRGQPGAVSVWDLRGPLFGVTPVTEDTITEEEETGGHDEAAIRGADRDEHRDDPVVPVVSAPDVADDGTHEPVTEPEPEVDGREPAAPVEPLAPRGGGEGEELTLPPRLFEALADHFSGDLKAENDLLRSALESAADAVERAAQTLREALTLGDEQRHGERRYRIGTRLAARLELMREHRDELPELLMPGPVAAFFHEHGETTITEAAAASTLWRFARFGHLEQVGRGVYRWAE